MRISVAETIKKVCPQLKLAILYAKVKNSHSSDLFWSEIEKEIELIKSNYRLEQINQRSCIAATRKVYKTLGKDPNRYRPSAEALCRRIVRDIPLYRVSTLVDLINLVSIRSGFSIGGFDCDKIQGDVELGVCTSDDEFEAIGRGSLNVEGLPLYRDRVGGIGTPTSDNERTKISIGTTRLLMIINNYGGVYDLQTAVDDSLKLLQKYAALGKYEVEFI